MADSDAPPSYEELEGISTQSKTDPPSYEISLSDRIAALELVGDASPLEKKLVAVIKRAKNCADDVTMQLKTGDKQQPELCDEVHSQKDDDWKEKLMVGYELKYQPDWNKMKAWMEEHCSDTTKGAEALGGTLQPPSESSLIKLKSLLVVLMNKRANEPAITGYRDWTLQHYASDLLLKADFEKLTGVLLAMCSVTPGQHLKSQGTEGVEEDEETVKKEHERLIGVIKGEIAIVNPLFDRLAGRIKTCSELASHVNAHSGDASLETLCGLLTNINQPEYEEGDERRNWSKEKQEYFACEDTLRFLRGFKNRDEKERQLELIKETLPSPEQVTEYKETINEWSDGRYTTFKLSELQRMETRLISLRMLFQANDAKVSVDPRFKLIQLD